MQFLHCSVFKIFHHVFLHLGHNEATPPINPLGNCLQIIKSSDEKFCSGSYYISGGGSSTSRVYCDMELEGGNFISSFSLNGSVYRCDKKASSTIYMKWASWPHSRNWQRILKRRYSVQNYKSKVNGLCWYTPFL